MSEPPPEYASVHCLPLGATSSAEDPAVSSANAAHCAEGAVSSSSPPVVLSWSPDELYSNSRDPPQPTPSRSVSSTSERSLVRTPPNDEPPRYIEARAPTQPVTYTFSPLGHNAMILVPPPESQDTRPLYHIAINMNCFNPLAHITTVRRGANEYGDYVGEFEMGMSEIPATLNIRGKHYRLGDAIRKLGGSSDRVWSWQFLTRKLYWHCKKDVKICSDSPRGSDTVYAKFTPTKHPNNPGHPVVMAQLNITPAGWPFFDDILMSGLIVERWRQTPKDHDHRNLFNFQI